MLLLKKLNSYSNCSLLLTQTTYKIHEKCLNPDVPYFNFVVCLLRLQFENSEITNKINIIYISKENT